MERGAGAPGRGADAPHGAIPLAVGLPRGYREVASWLSWEGFGSLAGLPTKAWSDFHHKGRHSSCVYSHKSKPFHLSPLCRVWEKTRFPCERHHKTVGWHCARRNTSSTFSRLPLGQDREIFEGYLDYSFANVLNFTEGRQLRMTNNSKNVVIKPEAQSRF